MPDKVELTQDEIFRLKEEIKMSEKLNEQELVPQMLEALQRYTGRHIPSMARKWSIVLNEIYPVVQFNLPATFFRTPRAFLKPRNKFFIANRRNPVTGQMEPKQLDSTKSARTQEAILNYTLQEIRYKQETRKVLLDALLFRHGVMWHGYKGEFGMTEEKSIFIKNENVFVLRVSPNEFLKDPMVSLENVNEGRWVGRTIDIPLQDLIDDDKLDVDKKQIKGEPGFGQKVGTKDSLREPTPTGGDDKLKPSSIKSTQGLKTLLSFTDPKFQQSPFSRFVRCYEVFMRPSKKEMREGKKGKIILITMEQDEPLRVNSWTYKAEGFPSKVLMFNPVPGQPFGLADIEVYSSIADHKNLVINQQIRNAEQLNRSLIVMSKEGIANEADIEKTRQGINDLVLYDDTDGDIRKKLMVVSPSAGSSQELYLLDQRIDKNLQDKSGVSDLRKGFLQSGEESAASVKLRSAGSSARPAYRQDIMADFLRDSVLYLTQLTKQFFPIKKAVRIVGSTDIEWSDDFTKEEIQAEVDVELDVISMLPENPEKELRELGEVLKLAIQAISDPNVKLKLQQENKTVNLAPLFDMILQRLRIKDPEVFRNIRPEESRGFASVAELEAARSNVQALMSQQQLPSPPKEGQDHRTRMEVYQSIAAIFEATGQQEIMQALMQLIQLHTALLEEEEKKTNPKAGQALTAGNLNLPGQTSRINGASVLT